MSKTFEQQQEEVKQHALTAIKHSLSLSDVEFHSSLDNNVATAIDSCSAKVLALTNKLVQYAVGPSSSKGKGKQAVALEIREDVTENFRATVVDVMDHLLERADSSLDRYLGRNKPSEIAFQEKTKQMKTTNPRASSQLAKPQLKFKRRSERHTLSRKPNAQVPLLQEDNGEGSSGAIHPYAHEISHISYPPHMFTRATPVETPSLESARPIWVDTTHALKNMMHELSSAKEIAVDLEHHSYRTYGGFVCLMQISTRKKDWIIDTLILREELEALNDVFTNPAILKVFHGAESDIVWLQQDFSLYIVNLFDTYHASQTLVFPRHSLASLLERYCNFKADKKHQLSDWRIRPLAPDMLAYAQSDTHFLLYVYDHLRNTLLSRASGPSLMREVLQKSEKTALRVYDFDGESTYDAETGTGSGGWAILAKKWNKQLEGEHLAVFRAVHGWRDALARSEDESTGFVLPNHYIFQLADRVPRDMTSLLAVFQPIPVMVKKHARQLLEAIQTAEKLAADSGLSSWHRMPATSKMTDRLPSRRSNRTSASQNWDSITARAAVLSLTSTMFTAKIVEGLRARSSILFPAHVQAALSSQKPSKTVQDIHKTIRIGHFLPTVSNAVNETVTDKAPSNGFVKLETDAPVTVPSSVNGQVAQLPKSEGTDNASDIVQVSRRKRKRFIERLALADENSTPASPQSGDEPSEDIVMFDYGTVPSILDRPTDGSDLAKPRKKKTHPEKKKKRLAANGVQYGDFPAPPRAPNQPKGGNHSRTFY